MPIEIGPDGTPTIIPSKLPETIIEIDETGKVGEPFVVSPPKDAIKPVMEVKPLI